MSLATDIMTEIKCPPCRGKGRLIGRRCFICKGSGRIKRLLPPKKRLFKGI